MILNIDTTNKDEIMISLECSGKIVSKKSIAAPRRQSELLLLEIKKILLKNKFDFPDLKKIKIASKGGSFTSLRIGVVTANTLAYALNVPVVSIGSETKKSKFYGSVRPCYDREPDIK